MTNNSIFIVDSTVVTSPDWNFPNTFSTLTIVKKQGGRIHIFLYGKQTSNRDYRMFLNQDSTPSGQWEQYITDSDLDGRLAFLSGGETALEAGSGNTRYRLQIDTVGNVLIFKSTDGGSTWPTNKVIASM